MPSKFIIMTAAGVLAMVLVLVVYRVTTAPSPHPQSEPLSDRVASDAALSSLQQQITSLGKEVTALKKAMAEQRAATASNHAVAAPQPAQPDERLPTRPSPTSDRPGTTDDGQFEPVRIAVESTMATEAVDTKWASATEQSIRNELQSAPFDETRLVNLACQTTLCRLQVEHDSEDSSAAFLASASELSALSNTDYFYTRDEQANGSVALTLYIARTGYPLPGTVAGRQ